MNKKNITRRIHNWSQWYRRVVRCFDASVAYGFRSRATRALCSWICTALATSDLNDGFCTQKTYIPTDQIPCRPRRSLPYLANWEVGISQIVEAMVSQCCHLKRESIDNYKNDWVTATWFHHCISSVEWWTYSSPLQAVGGDPEDPVPPSVECSVRSLFSPSSSYHLVPSSSLNSRKTLPRIRVFIGSSRRAAFSRHWSIEILCLFSVAQVPPFLAPSTEWLPLPA